MEDTNIKKIDDNNVEQTFSRKYPKEMLLNAKKNLETKLKEVNDLLAVFEIKK